eukprot:3149005-Rhodomonas_salina.1
MSGLTRNMFMRVVTAPYMSGLLCRALYVGPYMSGLVCRALYVGQELELAGEDVAKMRAAKKAKQYAKPPFLNPDTCPLGTLRYLRGVPRC